MIARGHDPARAAACGWCGKPFTRYRHEHPRCEREREALEELEVELGPGPYSVEAIASAMGITGARVRQLLEQAEERARAWLEGPAAT